MDYDFVILDNAFVLHNGKHVYEKDIWPKWRKSLDFKKQLDFRKSLTKSYIRIFGDRPGCKAKYI